MEKYLENINLKIQQLTEIAKNKSQNPYLEDEFSIMEEHAFEETLDRLHKYHGR